jgi:hypothetical protein
MISRFACITSYAQNLESFTASTNLIARAFLRSDASALIVISLYSGSSYILHRKGAGGDFLAVFVTDFGWSRRQFDGGHSLEEKRQWKRRPFLFGVRADRLCRNSHCSCLSNHHIWTRRHRLAGN